LNGQTAGPNSGNYTEKMMESVQLSTQLVNAILQYLGNRPFLEVANLINGIQKEAESQVKAPEGDQPQAE
jgi:hypothetical protein